MAQTPLLALARVRAPGCSSPRPRPRHGAWSGAQAGWFRSKMGFALRVPSSRLQIKPANRKMVQREPGSWGQPGSESSKLEDKMVALAAGQPVFHHFKSQ